jgi:hypothetical protein
VQGLLIEADEVSTQYTMDTCLERLYLPTSSRCLRWIPTQTESAPVTPPFVYNNQCSSVLLTSYIPVLIIGCSIQLILALVLPVIYHYIGKRADMAAIMLRFKFIPGVYWPSLWLNAESSDSLNRKRVSVQDDPSILLNSSPILCSDALNNATIMLTFGLCSPVLATAVVCVVVLKMKLMEMLVVRFTVMLESAKNAGNNVEGKAHLHVALVALGRVPFPYREVLRKSFWLLAWASAMFFALVCWDMVSDEVGWWRALWAPASALLFPVLLWAAGRGIGWRGSGRRKSSGSLNDKEHGVELSVVSFQHRGTATEINLDSTTVLHHDVSSPQSIFSPIHHKL